MGYKSRGASVIAPARASCELATWATTPSTREGSHSCRMSALEQSGDVGYKANFKRLGKLASDEVTEVLNNLITTSTTLVKGPRDQPGTIRHRFKKAALQHW
ncbi:hypothetical protein JOM56_005096 [Amanita muscaria]